MSGPPIASLRVSLGTSGHWEGGACVCSFDEWHVFAVTPVICNHRKFNGVSGPPFMGLSIEASSEPAWAIALEMLAANGLDVVILVDNEYTPTPAIWHATSTYSRSVRWIFCKASWWHRRTMVEFATRRSYQVQPITRRISARRQRQFNYCYVLQRTDATSIRRVSFVWI